MFFIDFLDVGFLVFVIVFFFKIGCRFVCFFVLDEEDSLDEDGFIGVFVEIIFNDDEGEYILGSMYVYIL